WWCRGSFPAPRSPARPPAARHDSVPRGAAAGWRRACPAAGAAGAGSWLRSRPAVRTGRPGSVPARWPSTPGPPHVVTVERQPLQGNEAGGVVDYPVPDRLDRGGVGQHMHADVLAFLRQTVLSAGLAAVAAAQVQVHLLVRAAGGGEVAGDRPQRAQRQAGLLLRLAVGHLFRLLVLVD